MNIFLSKNLIFLFVLTLLCSSNPVFADRLILKDGKEYSGELKSIKNAKVEFKIKDEIKEFNKANVIRIRIQKIREGFMANNLEELPDEWLKNKIKSHLPTSKDYPYAGSVILRDITTFTLKSPYLWEETHISTILILKERGKNHAINTLPYFHNYEKAEIAHAWTISKNGSVDHLDDSVLKREKLYATYPRYNELTRIRYSLKNVKQGAIIDIKTVTKRIKKKLFDVFSFTDTFANDIPTELYSVTIKIPDNIKLQYKLLNNKNAIKVAEKLDDAFKSYTFVRKNIPQHKPEANEAPWVTYMPTLIATIEQDKVKTIADYNSLIAQKLKSYFPKTPQKEKILDIASICNNFAQAVTVDSVPLILSSYIPSEIQITKKMQAGNNLDRSIMLLAELLKNKHQAELLFVRPKHSANIADFYNFNWYMLPLVRVYDKGKWNYPTPNSETYLYPETSPSIQGGTGICMYGESLGEIIQIPFKNLDEEKTRTIITIEDINPESGNIKVKLDLEYTGSNATWLRSLQTTNNANVKNIINSIIVNFYPRAKLLEYKLRTKPRNIKKQKLTCLFEVENYVNTPHNSQYLIFKPTIYSLSTSDIALKKRTSPIVRSLLSKTEVLINIKLPKDYEVNYLPEDFKGKNLIAKLDSIWSTSKNDTINMLLSSEYLQDYSTPSAYKKYRKQKLELAKIFDEFIVLKFKY